jgi:hypothetical protein
MCILAHNRKSRKLIVETLPLCILSLNSDAVSDITCNQVTSFSDSGAFSNDTTFEFDTRFEDDIVHDDRVHNFATRLNHCLSHDALFTEAAIDDSRSCQFPVDGQVLSGGV